jgi:hypothetical protein
MGGAVKENQYIAAKIDGLAIGIDDRREYR